MLAIFTLLEFISFHNSFFYIFSFPPFLSLQTLSFRAFYVYRNKRKLWRLLYSQNTIFVHIIVIGWCRFTLWTKTNCELGKIQILCSIFKSARKCADSDDWRNVCSVHLQIFYTRIYVEYCYDSFVPMRSVRGTRQMAMLKEVVQIPRDNSAG